MLADLDLLRDVNNTHGHLAGDAVLRGVADVLRSQLRPFDIPGRFGGEEFAIALPEASHEEALAIAERIRVAVAECGVQAAERGRVRDRDDLARGRHASGERDGRRPDPPGRPRALPVEGAGAQPGLGHGAAHGRRATGARRRGAGRETRNAPISAAAPRSSAGQRHIRVVELVAALAAAAGILFALLAVDAVNTITANPWTFVAFLTLSVGLQLIGTSVYGRGTDAASAIGIIATGFVLGPGPAIIVAAAAATVQFIRRRGKPYRAVFDLADFALSAATAAGIYQALNGGERRSPSASRSP